MKTTLELPDEMVQRAKIAAAERRITLRELVMQGLDLVLEEGQVTARERALRIFEEMDKLPTFAASDRLNRAESHAR